MYTHVMKASNMSLENKSWNNYSEDEDDGQEQLDEIKDYSEVVALQAAIILMTTIITTGIVGNIMALMAVRTTKKLQTASNAFVVNLSVCDLMFVSLILPFNIYTYLTESWNLPPALCKAVGFLGYTLTGTTILTITMIAYNRYKLVVDPQSYQQTFRPCNLALMILFSWIFPACLLIPAILEIWGRFGYVTMLVTCNLLLDHDSQSFKLFLLIVRAAIPCVLIVYYYLNIFYATKESHRRVLSRHKLLQSPHAPTRMDQLIQRKEMHLTKMMGAIFLVFFFSYFPCTISSIVDWNTVLSKAFHRFCLTSVYLGSAINPMIYAFMNAQFRAAYVNIFFCRCFNSNQGDQLLPTTSNGRSSFRKSKNNKSKVDPATSLAPATNQLGLRKHLSVSIINEACCSPLVSSEELLLQSSPSSTRQSPQSSVPTRRKMSVDSNGFTPLSRPDKDAHFHRSSTENTCLGLGDADSEGDLTPDGFQA